MRFGRKRFRVPLLASIVAAIAVPVGFALSLEPSAISSKRTVSVAPAAFVIRSPDTDVAARAHAFLTLPELSDAAKLLLIGTTLFGLAAVLRKAG
jgi:hypothetical protein